MDSFLSDHDCLWNIRIAWSLFSSMFFSILFLLLIYNQRENRKEFCYKFVSAFFFFFSWSSFFHLGFHVTGFSEKDKKKKKTDSHSLQTAFLQMMISGSPLKKESNWKQFVFWSSSFSSSRKRLYNSNIEEKCKLFRRSECVVAIMVK